MIRWFRLFVIACLLPAYWLAAVGVSTYDGTEPAPAGFRVDGHAHAPRSAVQIASPSVDSFASLAFDPHEAPASADERAGAVIDDISLLLHELGDTSDDMSDHCPATPPLLPLAHCQAAPADLALPRSVDAPPGRLLRPPRDGR